MVKAVTLPNGTNWKTQTAALAHFKNMLARYGDNEVVDSFEDHDDLLALLERYDQTNLGDVSKLGSGIERFERRLNRGEDDESICCLGGPQT